MTPLLAKPYVFDSICDTERNMSLSLHRKVKLQPSFKLITSARVRWENYYVRISVFARINLSRLSRKETEYQQ